MNGEIAEGVQLEGLVEDITYQNPVNGYTVLTLATQEELITCVGEMPGIAVGETVSLTGSMGMHPTYGRQLRVSAFSHTLPETVEQIFMYLSSGVIRGIGQKKAMAIVERFGSSTLDILENEPERLSIIKGISPEQAKNIGAEFEKQHGLRTVMLGLEKYGLTPAQGVRAFAKLGADAVQKIQENPYRLCMPEIGISFPQAVEIEQKLEVKPAADCRRDEGVLHALRKKCYEGGHTCLAREELRQEVSSLLNLSPDEADEAITHTVATAQTKSETMNDRQFLFLPSLHRAEKYIAERIGVISRFPPQRMRALSESIDRLQQEEGYAFEEEQRRAIVTAVNKGLLILTGGPGTGKTTAIKGMLRLFEQEHLEIALAAPTGRAAKRMSEVTGREASTLHRLLEVEWDESDRPVFQRNAGNPLDCEVLIVDELSMVDVSLFSSLLDALPLACRLILVGDSDQLPAVGAGNVLGDLIASQLLPVVQLKTVFRQALESKIIANAHRIVNGEEPDLQNGEGDFFHMERPDAQSAADTVCALCAVRLPKRYGWDPFQDIQVICPSKKGEAGTANLNRLLQERLNPPTEHTQELNLPGKIFRTGDKVMQTRNNYQLEWESAREKGVGIFNGDIGILTKIDPHSGNITVDFDGRVAVIPAENLSDLEHAYAITVHKSQGSEFTAVVLAVCGVAPRLRYRNLLYTAVTRAKTLLVSVGAKHELLEMAQNNRKSSRNSALGYFLEEQCGG